MLLEQSTIGATVFHREPGAEWTAAAVKEGTIDLRGLGIGLPLAVLYQGLTFPACPPPR